MNFSMDTAQQASRAGQSPSAIGAFLAAHGFHPMSPDKAAPSLLFAANDPEETAAIAFDVVVGLTLGADESPMDQAALLAMAAHAGDAGKKVAVALVQADPSGEMAHGRQLVEAIPALKNALFLAVPSPIRPFELCEKAVVPLVRAFKGRSVLKLKSRLPEGSSDSLDAVAHLTRALQRLANQQLPTVITEEARQMFFGLRRVGEDRLGLMMASMGPVLCGLSQENALKDSPLLAFVAAATRNTVRPIALSVEPPKTIGGVPPAAEAILDCRVLPGTGGMRALMLQLRELLDDACLTLEEVATLPPSSANMDPSSWTLPIVKALSANGLSHVVVPWVAEFPSDATALCPNNGQVLGLTAVGDETGDELARASWFKSVQALVEGLGL